MTIAIQELLPAKEKRKTYGLLAAVAVLYPTAVYTSFIYPAQLRDQAAALRNQLADEWKNASLRCTGRPELIAVKEMESVAVRENYRQRIRSGDCTPSG